MHIAHGIFLTDFSYSVAPPPLRPLSAGALIYAWIELGDLLGLGMGAHPLRQLYGPTAYMLYI